jgi:HSP20 family protein
MFGIMPRRTEKAGVPAPRREDALGLLGRELNSLFARVFGDGGDIFEVVPMYWGLDVEEMEKEVVVRAEAPGFEATDFEIRLTGDTLTIAAEHKEGKGKEVKEGEPPAEGRFVSLRRSVMLPAGLDSEKVEAVYRNGILEIRLPRKPEALGRRIEVKT